MLMPFTMMMVVCVLVVSGVGGKATAMGVGEGFVGGVDGQSTPLGLGEGFAGGVGGKTTAMRVDEGFVGGVGGATAPHCRAMYATLDALPRR